MQDLTQLIIKGIPAPIAIKRSRRTTLSVSVMISGAIKVSAPQKLSIKKIESFIVERKEWIIKHLENAENKTLIAEKFLDLKYFMLDGKQYKILRAQIKKPHLTEDALFLPLETLDFSEQKRVDNLMIKVFIKEISQKKLSLVLEDISRQTCINYQGFKLTDSTKCWGICTSNKSIRLNLRLSLLPLQIQKYVIVHELCHVLQLNHSPLFWKEVERFLPNYKALKKELKTYSAFINLYRN